MAGTAYLACDDEPVTREEICAAALASGAFPGKTMPTVSDFEMNAARLLDELAYC